MLFASTVGCGRKSVEPGQVRNSSNPPKFHDRSESIPRKQEPDANRIRFGFVTTKAAAVLRISPGQLSKHELLKDLSREGIEQAIAEFVGTKNSGLGQLENIWIAVDESFFKRERDSQVPVSDGMVLVVDFKEDCDSDDLNQAIENFQRVPGWAGRRESERRVIFATEGRLEHIETAQGLNPELVDLVQEWSEKTEIVAVVSGKSIRSNLQNLFDQAARNSSEPLDAQLADMPDSLHHAKLIIDLTDKALVSVVIALEDESLATAVKEKFAQAFSEFKNFPIMPVLKMAMGQAGEIKSFDQLTVAIQEVLEGDLLSIESTKSEVNVVLKRPANFDALFKAVLGDVERMSQPKD